MLGMQTASSMGKQSIRSSSKQLERLDLEDHIKFLMKDIKMRSARIISKKQQNITKRLQLQSDVGKYQHLQGVLKMSYQNTPNPS